MATALKNINFASFGLTGSLKTGSTTDVNWQFGSNDTICFGSTAVIYTCCGCFMFFGCASFASSANYADCANSASYAGYANCAGSASYASCAGYVDCVGYASSAGCASYASCAGYASGVMYCSRSYSFNYCNASQIGSLPAGTMIPYIVI